MSQVDLTNETLLLRSELPLLASRAAIELDNYLQKKPSSFQNIRLLAQRLQESTDAMSGGSEHRFIADPAMSDMIIRAIDASQSQVRSIQEAANEAWRIAESLHSVEKTQCSAEESSLKKLRTFCIELARSAAMYRQMIDEAAQPTHSQWS